MGKVNRLTASVAMTVTATVLLAPAVAAAEPSPSPALSTVLVAPAGTYFESTDPTQDGPVTLADYAGTDSLVLDELRRDGFVQAYERTWVDQDRKHVVVEEVVAFGGHRDAASWLNTFKGLTTSQYLVRPITANGVDSYVGNHYADTSTPLYYDQGVFIKGNDFFEVGAISKADDLGDIATAQAKREFDAAPGYSISPNQWPENAGKSSFNIAAAALPLAIGGGFVFVILILVTLVVVVLLTRRRQPQMAPFAPVGPATVASGPLMSQDGRYWWDGRGWRDATTEVPPDAMKSPDGFYWWDSRTWRPKPATSPTGPSEPQPPEPPSPQAPPG